MTDIRQAILDEGYAVTDGLAPDAVEGIRSKFLEVTSRLAEANAFGRVATDADMVRLYAERKELWIGAVDQFPFIPELLAACGNPRLLELAHQAGIRFPAISGGGVSLLVNMPSDDHRLYRTHQDITYIPGSLNGITMWVPLQDSPLSLGPLEVVPGSHKRGLLPTNGASDVKKNELVPPVPDEAFLPLPIKKGQCIVFSKFLVHRSGRNRSDNVRYSLQFRYNDLASAEYQKRHLTFNKLDENDPNMTYDISA